MEKRYTNIIIVVVIITKAAKKVRYAHIKNSPVT